MDFCRTNEAAIMTYLICLLFDCVPSASARDIYYSISAEEVLWNYVPEGSNLITGANFSDMDKVFVENSADRIGPVFVKALYFEYTDASFSTRVLRDADLEHMGFLGPVIRAAVGDVLHVTFFNQASMPYSLHPHGVQYDKQSEGAPYNDGVNSTSGFVCPQCMYQYTWRVPRSAGPAAGDVSTVIWPYHSHTHEVADPASGLVGFIVVCASNGCAEGAHLPPPTNSYRYGLPHGIDQEVFLLFYIINENESNLLDTNIAMFTTNVTDVADEGFVESNLKHAINGYLMGNQPMIDVVVGTTVRWYVSGMVLARLRVSATFPTLILCLIAGFGNEADLHTVHWHGQTLVHWGRNVVDTLSVSPAEFYTLDMQVENNTGIFLLHCHVDDHMMAGMMTRYSILPCANCGGSNGSGSDSSVDATTVALAVVFTLVGVGVLVFIVVRLRKNGWVWSSLRPFNSQRAAPLLSE